MSYAEPPPPIITDAAGVNYATGPALGKGGFAICHRAERYEGSKPTGQMVALKIVKSVITPAKLAQKFISELQIHSKLSHPNVVAFYRAFSHSASTYVVLELCCNGSLADMIKKRKQLTLPEIRRHVIQICGAVKYLHSKHIIHRDLKTGNLFLDENMNVKVGDFGLAALLVTEKEMEAKRRTTMCGTPNYLAPEILEKSKGHDEKADLWSIGAIIFTLAVGKAPFHASTKEEIYKKATQGKYSWPELTTSSAQSSDLRDLVSGLLVEEDRRLAPDQIVSHSFFKIPYIPTSIPSSAREREPQWPEPALPSADVIRRGFTDAWYALCKKSGVGEFAEGKCFVASGSKKSRSVVADISREIQEGKQPVMPIPSDVVYISPVNDWDVSPNKTPEPEEQQPARPPSHGLREVQHNEVATTRPKTAQRQAARDAQLMPPPPKPSSRPGRSGTVRKAARTISEESARSAEATRPAPDQPSSILQVAKTRLAPGAATAALKELNSSSSTSRTTCSQHSSDVDSGKSQRPGTVKRSADASLARRPRATKAKERPVSPDVVGPLATLDELRQISPMKCSRKKAAETEVIDILSDHDSDHQKPVATVLSLPPPPKMTRRLPVPKPPSTDPNAVPGTDPQTVLERLRIFRDGLASVLDVSRSKQPPATQSGKAEKIRLPFISRWVDYSRKHGVGYVMSDGTVGVVINASPKNGGTPVTHVLARNGQRWLARVGKDMENLDQVPLEILEDRGEDGIARKVYKGLGSVKEGALAAEAERRRTLSVLWAKFGRYMSKSLDGDEADYSYKQGNFVRFYQRLGSVGLWAFSDGSLQLHFPDHTKLVLSEDATQVAMTCITTEAAAYLASNTNLLDHHIASREVYSDATFSLLYEGGRIRSRLMRANQLQEKLGFVLSIVEQWIGNGGMGCMDVDEGIGEEILWAGMEPGDGTGKKVERISVGRFGGDLR